LKLKANGSTSEASNNYIN